jgi:hypothetical protein
MVAIAGLSTCGHVDMSTYGLCLFYGLIKIMKLPFLWGEKMKKKAAEISLD